jgi:redox-regulated HSP33 family molecular chaperone
MRDPLLILAAYKAHDDELKAMSMHVTDLQLENQKLKEALSFYAAGVHYDVIDMDGGQRYGSIVDDDQGVIAREALGESE